MKSHWREAGIVFLLTAVTLMVFFYPAVLQNRLIYCGDYWGSDLLELNIPRRVLAAQAVAHGEAPLWEPRLGNGLPLLAEEQAGVFYPTTLPLYLSLSPTAATNYSILITLWAAMMGGYWLARTYGASPLAAFFAALAYGLSGSFVFRLKHLNMIQVIAWLPCSLALIRLYWKNSKLLYLLLLTGVWAWQFLAGHPHVTYISWLTCYLYVLILAFEPADKEVRQSERSRCLRLIGKLLVCTAGALFLSAVQLLPTWDLVQHSNRAGAKTWEELEYFPFKASHLLRLVAPYSSGNPAEGTLVGGLPLEEGIFWETSPYMGLIPLLLSIGSFIVLRRRNIYGLGALALLFLLAALGPKGGVYWLFWKFCPAFDLFRFPARCLIPFQCFMAILAAVGGQAVYDLIKRRYGVRVSSMVLSAMLLLTLADLYCLNGRYQEYISQEWEQKPVSWSLIEDEAQRVYSPSYMMSASKLLNGGWKGNTPNLLYNQRVLGPDLAAVWGVNCHSDHVVFEGGVVLTPYFALQVCEAGYVMEALELNRPLVFADHIYDWFRAQNVSHLTSFVPLADADANPHIADVKVLGDPFFPDNPLYIYTLRNPLPLFRLVADNEVTADVPDMLKSVQQRLKLADVYSLYERRIGNSDSAGTVKTVQTGRTLWQLEVDCSKTCYLTAAINYDHNWQACREDGSVLPIVPFNHAYQAILLEPGTHRITLKYQSQAFAWGWKISALAWFILLLMTAIEFRKGEDHGKVK